MQIQDYDLGFENYEYLKFLTHKMPNEVRCTNSKHEDYIYKPVGEAMLLDKWVQFNLPSLKNYLIMDCDYTDLYTILDKLDKYEILYPTFIIETDKGVQLFWRLKVPVSAKNARAYNYYKSIKKMITGLLGADVGFTNSVARNPFNNSSFVSQQLFKLEDFRYLLYDDYKKHYEKLVGEPFNKVTRSEKVDIDFSEVQVGERHTSLFNHLRNYGYDNAGSENLKELLQEEADRCNSSMPEPMTYGEIRRTVKAIYTWISTFYQGISPEKIAYNRELARRKAEATINKIETFIRFQLDYGFTIKEVAEMSLRVFAKDAGVSVNSLRKYRTQELFKVFVEILKVEKDLVGVGFYAEESIIVTSVNKQAIIDIITTTYEQLHYEYGVRLE